MTLSKAAKAFAESLKTSDKPVTRNQVITWIANNKSMKTPGSKLTTYYGIVKLLGEKLRRVSDEKTFVQKWFDERDVQQAQRDDLREPKRVPISTFRKLLDESVFTEAHSDVASIEAAYKLCYLAAVSGRRPSELVDSEFFLEDGRVYYKPKKKRGNNIKFELLPIGISPELFVERVQLFRNFLGSLKKTQPKSVLANASRVLHQFDPQLTFHVVRGLYAAYKIKEDSVPVERENFARRKLLAHTGNGTYPSCERYGFSQLVEEDDDGSHSKNGQVFIETADDDIEEVQEPEPEPVVEEPVIERITCECGSTIRVKSMWRHRKTRKHQEYIAAVALLRLQSLQYPTQSEGP